MVTERNLDFNKLSIQEKYSQLVRVKEIMERYGMEEGWMRWDYGNMNVYQGDVEEGVYIKIGWVRLWVAAFW